MPDGSTITDALDRGRRWFPDREAFVQGDHRERRSMTYAAVAEESRRFAVGLGSLGVDPGDRVAFLTRNTVEHAVAYFGVLRTGAIPATIHHRESPGTVRTMLEAIDPAAVIVQPQLSELAESIPDGDRPIEAWIALDQLGSGPAFAEPYTEILGEPDASLPTLRPDDHAFINFSSGTTGVPKPIVHTHRDIVESAHLGAFKYRIRSDDRTLKTATPSFIAWANATFSHVNAGATVVYLEEATPTAILDAIESEAVTSFITVPTLWRKLLAADYDAYDLGSVRFAGYAGEPIGSDLFDAIRSTFTVNVCAVYGTTETMSSSLVLFPEDVSEETLDSVGYPVPNTEVRVIDPSGRDPEVPVDRGTVGEVVIRGPSVAEAVWDDPETTASTFHDDGWLFTGDLGYIGTNGLLYLEGRRDHTIISGGINVHPDHIRAIIAEHPDVESVAVIGVPDENWGQVVAAVVVPAAETITGEQLTAHCRDHPSLADYQRPRRYEFVGELPRTGTGKIAHRSLQELFDEPIE